MSSRTGNVMSIDELIESAKNKVLELSKGEFDSLNQFSEKEKNEIALKIGIGAIKYAMLRLDRNQDLMFDLIEILDIKGNGSPYIQYAYARMISILNKSKFNVRKIDLSKVKDINDDEKGLIKEILHFNEVVKLASNNFSPHLITTYLFNLCKMYSAFYEKHKILSDDENQYLRLSITKVISQIIKISMDVLGIEVMGKL